MIRASKDVITLFIDLIYLIFDDLSSNINIF